MIHHGVCTYIQLFIFSNFLLGRGDYNNAQPAKSSIGLLNLVPALSGNGKSADFKFLLLLLL